MLNAAPRPGADEEWEDLLRQWRAQSASEPRPFFYARVCARLNRQVVRPHALPGWLRWSAYATTLGMMVLVLSGDCAAGATARADARADSAQPAWPGR